MNGEVIYNVKNGHLVVELPLDDPQAFMQGVTASLRLMDLWAEKKEEKA